MTSDYFPLPEARNYRTNTKCSCGHSYCKSITKAFRKINDVRGHLKVVPNSRASATKSKTSENDLRYKARAAAHFPSLHDTLVDQSNTIPIRETHNSRPKKIEAYFAQWHFHKQLFESKADGSSRLINGTTIPNTMTIGEAENLGLYYRLGGCTYSGTDSVIPNCSDKEDEIFLVPTVQEEVRIKADLVKAQESKAASDALADALQMRPNRPSSSKRPSDAASQDHIVSPGKRVRTQSKEPNFIPMKRWNKLSAKDKRTNVMYLRKDLKKAFREKQTYITRENEKIATINELESKIESLQIAINQQNNIQTHGGSTPANEISEALLTNEQLLQARLEVLQTYGLNRISIASKHIYQENKKLSNSLFGCSDFEFLINFIESMFDIKYVVPSDPAIEGVAIMLQNEDYQMLNKFCSQYFLRIHSGTTMSSA